MQSVACCKFRYKADWMPMIYFRKYLSTDPDLPPPPTELIALAKELERNSKTPESAESALDQLVLEIPKYAADHRFLLPCGLLLEKMRLNEGMLDAWYELYELFPGELLPVRMIMRWYRRLKLVEEGLVRLRALCPNALTNLKQAEQLVVGLVELKEFSELDIVVPQVLKAFPEDIPLRLSCARMLFQLGRVPEAKNIVSGIDPRASLSPTAQKFVNEIKEHASILESYDSVDSAAMIGKMVETFADRSTRPLSKNGMGPIVFYTGQLGAGGAERQMTRIAGAFMRAYKNNTPIAGRKLLVAPKVCIRHTTAATQSGFFLPVLKEAGIDVHILNEARLPKLSDFAEISDDLRELMAFLPVDLYENTLKLARYFKDSKAEYAYCWQDGGVLTAALAALIAGVPRIIASFRGMPPNLRPDLFRPQMFHLFKALREIPGVSFSANNSVSARAYEQWLGFASGEVTVVHNAVPPILPDGDSTTHKIWQDIVAKSPECNQTVLGVFRFEMVKNPRLWIEVAAAFLQNNDNTRFVVFGTGSLLQECRRRVVSLGLENRVFLPGTTHSIGFFMNKANLLLHLARMEGLPNVLIEAHLSSLPLLATPAGGTGEILEDGVSGLLLSRAVDVSTEEVTEKLAHLLANPEMMQKMGEAGFEQAKLLFSIESILDKTVSLFTRKGLEPCAP